MIAGISPAVETMRRFISRVQPGRPVLIGGEPGTGKKMLARKITDAYYSDDTEAGARLFFLDEAGEIPRGKPGPILITESRETFDNLALTMEQSIWLTPLRERIEDIPVLVDHFLADAPVTPKWLDSAGINRLLAYWWPFNVAELKLVVTEKEGYKRLPYGRLKEVLSFFPVTTIVAAKMEHFWHHAGRNANAGKFFHLFLESVEREFIKSALNHCGGSVNDTAELMGVHRNTLSQKLKKLKIRK